MKKMVAIGGREMEDFSIERKSFLREDMIDIEIIKKFDRDVKEGKIKLISQPADKFLKDLEKWAKE